MTWAEFQIRSFGFNRVRKWQMQLVREISYEVHTVKYMFGKTKPPKKKEFWNIEGGNNKAKEVSALKAAFEQYEKEKNG